MIETKPNSLTATQIWLLAARPKTLPVSAAPVIIGSAVAFSLEKFQLIPALVTLAAALLLQIGANLSNDLFDYLKGADTHERLGPTRVTQAGLLTPRQVIAGLIIVFGLAALCGIYLIAHAGWPILGIGVLAILSALAYTGGPYPLAYHGLGELFVFLFFGLAAVCGTVYIQSQSLPFAAWWAALPVGMIAMGVLTVNNLRDIATDRASGKNTLAVRFGEQGTRIEYTLWIVLAYLAPIGAVLTQASTAWVFLSWLSIPYAVKVVKLIFQQTGRGLNQVLAKTGQLEFIFAIFYSIGLIVAGLI